MELDPKERILEQRAAKRRKNALIMKCIIAGLILLVVLLIAFLIKAGIVDGQFRKNFFESGAAVLQTEEDGQTEASREAEIKKLLAKAAKLAEQYDYTAAINLLSKQDDFYTSTKMQSAVADYQNAEKSLVSYPVDQVPHIFFHTLVKDSALAFDGDSDEAGYNQFMTTIDEFNKIIETMYEKGYVMVSLHDMATVDKDGNVTQGQIRLPEGKTPFVLSQDDVSYYHYMDGDGFAQKLIVDKDGTIRNTYVEADGSISIGDYDMVPLIDRFVEEHPDFAYHGHKGVLALTGYEGVLGYRTDEVYKTKEASRLTEYQTKFLEENPDFDYEQEVKDARKVAEAMKDDGWEFASHTWGHINPLAVGYDGVVKDTERYKANIEPIIGETDILIFAFGADIGDWQMYSDANEYFTYYKSQGFNIYCNVDGSRTYWVQFGSNYMRCGRRNLDGYAMYYRPESCEDLFNVDDVFDPARPTPVPDL